jgi:hypothetical protein
MLFWHVPAPNEALLITGSKRRGNEAPFRIVTGRGSLVLPIIRKPPASRGGSRAKPRRTAAPR